MVNSIGYTQRHHQEKQDIKVQKLGSHWKLRDQNEAVVNRIYIAMVETSSKEIHGHLYWETLTILKDLCAIKEAIAKQIWR